MMLLIFVYDAHFCSIFHEYCQDENMGKYGNQEFRIRVPVGQE